MALGENGQIIQNNMHAALTSAQAALAQAQGSAGNLALIAGDPRAHAAVQAVADALQGPIAALAAIVADYDEAGAVN